MFDPMIMEKLFFMLQPVALSHCLLHYLATIVSSVRALISRTHFENFDATFLADAGSGIDALFAPRRWSMSGSV